MSTNTSVPAQPTAPPLEADRIERMSRQGWQVLGFVFLAWVLDAADSTIYSLTLPSIREEYGLSLTVMGMLASIFLAGTVIGSLVLPVLADRKGRRVGMVTCIGIFSVFTGAVAVASSTVTIATARFLTGMGAGAEWPIGAAYLSEMVPAKKRGFAMGFMQAGYPVGYFLAGLVVAVVTWLGLGWRACYLALVIPAVLCIPILSFLKESPTWERTHRERALMANTGHGAKDRKFGFRALFAPGARRYTLISTGLHIFGAIFSYGMVVWVPSAISLDFHVGKMETAQFVMFSWGVGTLGYIASGPISDRFGRKAALSLYTCLGLVAVLALYYLHGLASVSFGQLLIPGSLIGISLGVSAIYITYTSEIFPAQLRTLGLGFSVAMGKITAVFVPTIMGAVAQASSVTLALLLSTAIGLLMLPVIFSGPETARRRLEEITA